MKKKLNLSQILIVGSLLFGLFFGAGNLIFPIELGQQSGTNGIASTIGFLISGVGLTILGVIASAVSKSDSLYEMAKPVGRGYAIFLTCLLYLTIGPFFAMPRTSTVAFEVGIRVFVGDENIKFWLLIYSTVFFAGALLFALRPAKIMDTIGKFLTPSFLVLLSVLVIFSIAKPMGEFAKHLPTEKYQSYPLIVGLIDGYNTMDVLASLAFAIIIITNIRKLGVTEAKSVGLEVLKAGILCAIGMSVVYASLSYMGSTSQGLIDGDNGGLILSGISKHYLGASGQILLAAIVTIACFKTAVGLINACAEMFTKLFPKHLNYNKYAVIFTLISFLIANLGLTQIIALSIPILMFLYPLSITLLILSLAAPIIKKDKNIYLYTTAFTAAAAFFDLLKAAPAPIKNTKIVETLIEIAETMLPGYSLGFGWIIPALIGLIVGVIVKNVRRK